MLTAVETSVNRRIFSATMMVGILSVCVKLAGWAKLLVVAHRLGVGDDFDAFLIAFLIPSFLAEVAGAPFNASLIPTLVEVRERQGRCEAQRLFSGVAVLAGLILCGVAAVTFVLRRYALGVLASSFSGAKLGLTNSLLLAMLPLAVMMGIGAVWRAALHADEKFALAAAAPALTPILTILLLLPAGRHWGAHILAAGALAGTALELLVVGWAVRRSGYSLLPRWTGIHWALRQVMGQYAPMVAGAILLTGAPLVDQAFAAALGAGAVSALSYGTKLVAVMLAIGPVALSTVVFPHFSRMAAVRDAQAIRQTLRTYSRLIVLVTVPLALALAASSESIVRMLFQRGAFTASDTQMVAVIQRFAAAQIPFAVLGVLILRAVSAVKANRWLMWGAAVNLAATVVLDYELSRHWGVPGIALTRAAVSMVSLGYLCAVLGRVLRRL